MPEFQGGSYNPWGGPQGGCPGDIGPDFANLFYRDLIYQRVTAVSLYMLYGGTNWGWLAAPVVGTWLSVRLLVMERIADRSVKPLVTTIPRPCQRTDLSEANTTRRSC